MRQAPRGRSRDGRAGLWVFCPGADRHRLLVVTRADDASVAVQARIFQRSSGRWEEGGRFISYATDDSASIVECACSCGSWSVRLPAVVRALPRDDKKRQVIVTELL